MEDHGGSAPLVGAEIHGFHTASDMDVEKLMKDASARWFRPNEVHAILSNYTRFKIQPQPFDTPSSGSVLLFNRKMLRNFRKDGHNWKKKKDGKTVQEAHEKLKIGNEERIHVYYARGEDDPSFHRRCYWLLNKELERIVLVHYRQIPEDNAVEHLPASSESPEALYLTNYMRHASPQTHMNSTSGSANSDMTGSAAVSEEINSGENDTIYSASAIPLSEDSTKLLKHRLNLRQINTLDWEDLVEEPAYIGFATQQEGDAFSSDQDNMYESRNHMNNDSILPSELTSSFGNSATGNCFSYSKDTSSSFFETMKDEENPALPANNMNSNSQATDFPSNPLYTNEPPRFSNEDMLLSQNRFGQWNYMNDDSRGSLNDLQCSTPILNSHISETPMVDHSSIQQVFIITDISPSWAYCTEETKVLVIGHFHETHKHLEGSNIYCAFGETYVATEMVQSGVYRCTAVPQTASFVDFYLTLDCHTPISQVLSFEYRSIIPCVNLNDGVTSPEDNNVKFKEEDIQLQIRLAHLLFSTTDKIAILSSKISPKSRKEATKVASLTSPLVEKDWLPLLGSMSNEVSFVPSIKDLFELILRNKLQEWLLEKVAEGSKTTPRDKQGLGAIHLCATLGYSWAIPLFSLSGMSLDFRDVFGWTALHWAAYCGREKMVGALLSAGANPSLVTDPTPEFPGGCTASDVASSQGYDGLAVYLAEKGLTAHLQAMSLSGNISSVFPPKSESLVNLEDVYSQNLSEEDLLLKESLTAYRNAADAADCIQAALRERSLKIHTRAVELAKPEMEATNIIAAMKIQNAFRHYNKRKMMKAAARIQTHFRTWQTRKNYLYMRRQTIKIQAAFRGHQARKQYRKITWSVGIIEKAILRWRLKRKGLRGIQPVEAMRVNKGQEDTLEEDFYRISRDQAEERVKRSVIRVQAMFRSHQAQQEYRRMKQAHEYAKVEYNEIMRTP